MPAPLPDLSVVPLDYLLGELRDRFRCLALSGETRANDRGDAEFATEYKGTRVEVLGLFELGKLAVWREYAAADGEDQP